MPAYGIKLVVILRTIKTRHGIPQHEYGKTLAFHETNDPSEFEQNRKRLMRLARILPRHHTAVLIRTPDDTDYKHVLTF